MMVMGQLACEILMPAMSRDPAPILVTCHALTDVPMALRACKDYTVGILGKLHLGKGNETDFRGCVEQEAQVEAL